ncbi:hypothetical protein Vafri_20218, partial [Volvox africanus]
VELGFRDIALSSYRVFRIALPIKGKECARINDLTIPVSTLRNVQGTGYLEYEALVSQLMSPSDLAFYKGYVDYSQVAGGLVVRYRDVGHQDIQLRYRLRSRRHSRHVAPSAAAAYVAAVTSHMRLFIAVIHVSFTHIIDILQNRHRCIRGEGRVSGSDQKRNTA